MAVVFPNFPQSHFRFQSRPRSAFSAPQVDMSKLYERKEAKVGKVKVEWPTHLTESTSSPSTSWLAGRKAEAEKRQQDKMDQDKPANPWLIATKGQVIRPPANLAELVRKGLLGAGKDEEKVEEKKKVDERVPYPFCEDVTMNNKRENDMERVIEKFTSPWFSVPQLPIPEKGMPWNPPKSNAQSVREGLLRAKESGWEDRNKNPLKSMFSNTQLHISSWLINASAEPKKEIFKTAVKQESPEIATNQSPSLRGSMLHLDSQSIDQWMQPEENQDVQSEGSIITLTNSDVTIEDFDDFSDMEHELSQWICKA